MSGSGDLRCTIALFRRFSLGQRGAGLTATALLALEAVTAVYRPEVVRYDRARCVLRYDVLWKVRHTGRVVKQVLYGKVYVGTDGSGVGAAVARLRAQPEHGGGRTFLNPRFRGYLPEQRLVLLDAIPGAPKISSLVRECAVDPTGLPALLVASAAARGRRRRCIAGWWAPPAAHAGR